MPRALALSSLLLLLAAPLHAGSKPAPELLYFPEGNRLRRVDVDTIGKKDGPRAEVFVHSAGEESGGGGDESLLFISPNRDVNGMLCAFPDGSGRFLMGEDTGQPSPPPGWGVFDPNGRQIGKLVGTYFPRPLGETQGEPYGCAFAPDPDPSDDELPPLFTSEVGGESIMGADGQLFLWFPPYDRFPWAGATPTDDPSDHFCKLATDIGVAGGVAVDALGRVYVASASGFRIFRFSPPFPTAPDAAGGCGGVDPLGSPVADAVQREVFVTQDQPNGMVTFTGLAISPAGTLFAASVVTGVIAEYDLDGNLLRQIVAPPAPLPPIFPTPTGNPQGLAFGEDGTLYYGDLALEGTFPFDVGPGDDGKVRRVRFDKRGDPLEPEVVMAGLAFPDAVAVLPGDLERKKAGGKGKTEWPLYAGGPERQFSNPKEKKLGRRTVAELRERWRFPTGAIVTASPVVARVDVPGEGAIQVVYVSSWDQNFYAIRLSDGSELWHFTFDGQPGSSYPGSGSAAVARVGDRHLVFAPWGEKVYAFDAATGEEVWRFTAGTGCGDVDGLPPGLCAFDGERNQVETSPIVHDGRVFFGMDVNDRPVGKGGFFAVDAEDGRMAWFFDLESGSTCVPDAADEIRRFDGYHDEGELGLPAGFLATRSGCDFDRTPTGCGNVWSSPALDTERGLLFFGSSNCDTDSDPGTNPPPPPMPPYDEGLVALRLDGTPAWRWRPREVGNDDFAFGATPNLFTIKLGKANVDVVGIGGKDGLYYVIDRDGVNEDTGLGFEPATPLALPYWYRQLVPGGFQGGVIGTPAVDAKARRIYIATAPGQDVFTPQQPTVRALDMDTGDVLWSFGTEADPERPSFGPVGATAELVFVGSVPFPLLRILDAKTGELLAEPTLDSANLLVSAIASGPVVVDGTLLVGTGIGGFGEGDQAEATARTPAQLLALCVPSSKGCPKDAPPIIGP